MASYGEGLTIPDLNAVWEWGTNSACAAEWREQRLWTCVVEHQSSLKYGGATNPTTQCLTKIDIWLATDSDHLPIVNLHDVV